MKKVKLGRKTARPGRVNLTEAAERDRLIVAVATEEFVTKGFEKATIDVIAERCRVSRTTIYTIFGSKEGLFSHICTQSTAQQSYQMEDALSSNRSFRDAIRSAVEIMLQTTEIQKGSLLLLAVDVRHRFPSVGRMMLDHALTLARPLSVYLKQKSRRGAL